MLFHLLCTLLCVLARPLQHLELGHPDGKGGSWATTTSACSVVIGAHKRRERERENEQRHLMAATAQKGQKQKYVVNLPQKSIPCSDGQIIHDR